MSMHVAHESDADFQRHLDQYDQQMHSGGYAGVTPLGPPPQGEPLFATGRVESPPTPDGSRWYARADVDLNHTSPDRYVLLNDEDVVARGYVTRSGGSWWKAVRIDGNGGRRTLAGVYGNLYEAQLAVGETV